MYLLSAISPFLAATVGLSEAGEVRELVVYELKRLGGFDDPRLFWALAACSVAAAVFYVLWIYRRELDPLPFPLRWVLPGLRLIAVAGGTLFFLGLEKRVDQQVVTDSHVEILIDTSQSMSVEDEKFGESELMSRAEAIELALTDSSFVDSLRSEHDVSLSVFDEEIRHIKKWERLEQADLPVGGQGAEEPVTEVTSEESLEWRDQLKAQGAKTRLGDALFETIERYDAAPLAGVIVMSDGGQNTGVEPLSLTEEANSQEIPFHVVGVGSTKPRRNLRVQEVSAPARVYPQDRATVSAYIQAEDFAGRSVEVQLLIREAEAANSAATTVGQQTISFTQERESIPVQFEFEPAEVGRLLVEIRLNAPTDDQNPDDNRREAEVEVVETQTRVLLIASGATRDYRFLRNQLRRDQHATVDVWLQSALPGISQDADQIINSFPQTKEELYPYDCIVAFDPDWTLLDAQQADLIESWVAEEAGGLIVVAGPVHTASWVQSPEHAKIRSLYPVEFQRRLTLLDDGLYGSRVAWPIAITREAEDSRYLWLADSAEESRSVWSQFAGVFGCYAVKGPKPGAQVLARYSDPDAGLSVERPVYWAEHFYGGGRVFYMGSGEMWRLRSLDPKYFEVFYTRLIRHVSQGRLMRGSSHGRLLVQKDRYSIGDDVVVRAQLSTASREPLMAERVTARVVDPQGIGKNLQMDVDPSRPGNFVGQFSIRKEGSYRIELPIPDVLDEQLVRRIQASVPSLEFDRTRRNEQLLAALASQSGGQYYTSLNSAIEGLDGLRPLSEQIASRAELKTLRGATDEEFTERLNRMLLAVMCGALSLEWLLRRLVRLA